MASGKSDGSVIIDTRIDTSGFGKGMADAKQKVSAFSGSLNKLGNSIKNTFSQTNTANAGKGYDELRKEIAKTESQLDKLIEKQIRFVETGGNIKSRTMAGMEYDIEMTRKRLEELRSQLSLTSKDMPKKVGKMNTWIERLKKSFDSLNKSTKKSHRSILTMLGTSLLFSTVFRAISTVTKGFTEGINNLAQYSDKANGTMSALKSSLTQLKNSFATAFMPIITAVTPAVTHFISLISKATSIAAAFLSALTGNKTYTKAIEVQEDYAASLDKTADSAKKAQKYLSGLDEIRTFTEKDSDKSGVVSPENMFTEEEIDSPILNFADKVKSVIETIKTFIKDEDWEGLGAYLSDGIISGLGLLSEKLNEFDWENFGENVGKFIKGINWTEILKSVGKSIWKGINSGIEFWKEMFNAAPIETAILTATAVFLPLATKISGIAVIIGGLVLGVASFFDMWKNGFSWLKEALMILGIALAAIVAIILGAPALIAGVVAGIVAAVATLVIVIKDNWEKISEFFKKLLNGIIGFINGLVSGFVSAINVVIGALNKINFDVPDWVPVIGGETVGFNIKEVKAPRIPYLATGAVIPPNAPFMAMLGDQKHGTNIEAPLETIKQAVREVMGSGSGGRYQFIAQINRRTLFDEIIEEAKIRQSTTGRNLFDLS